MDRKSKIYVLLGCLIAGIFFCCSPFILITLVLRPVDTELKGIYSDVIIPLCKSIEDDRWEEYFDEEYLASEGYETVERQVYIGLDEGKFCEDYKPIGTVRTVLGGGDYFTEKYKGVRTVAVGVNNRQGHSVRITVTEQNGVWKIVGIYVSNTEGAV